MSLLLENPMSQELMEKVLPDDLHNQTLVGNVHPADWTNPEPAPRYNLVVVGAGTAGLVAAAGAAGLGARVALVERHLLGGDCLNYGCVPSKGIISAARIAAAVRDAGQFGVHVPDGWKADFPAVMERMRRLRAGISQHDSAARFRDLGVDVFLGDGRFTGPDTIAVAGHTPEKGTVPICRNGPEGASHKWGLSPFPVLRFSKAVIATGARAAAPPIPGLDQVDYLTNESVFSLTELPKRIGIIGAGPIGCELAQTFARLGSEVILVEAAHGILPREEPDAAEIVKESLLRDGVRLLCCGQRIEVRRRGGKGDRRLLCEAPEGPFRQMVPAPFSASDQVFLHVESHGTSHEEPVDKLLVAVGRAPNVEGLNLETAGVAYDVKAGIKVDAHLRTTNSRVFAAGDVCSQFKFTHAADFMARIVIRNALFKGRAKASTLVIPWCTYTSPEIAHVGLYPKEAEARGIAIDTYTQELNDVDRAVLEGETEGFVRIHTKKGTDRIVGATIVAADAGDMISEITLAMTHGLGLKRIADTIHPYPTQAEAIRKVGDLYNRSRLTPFVKSLFQKWLAWTR
jgi:pyruvate/2-oxoglutarate dehydrogenase complex dihydrolipoamide dehydrogenase (E3) component